jgi:hypothetical protein
MLSSGQIGKFAGYFGRSYRDRVERLARISTLTVGATATVFSASIYIAFHLLRIGV